MPVLIKTIHEIVQARRLDTYWLRFTDSLFAISDEHRHAREDQLAWLEDNGLEYEKAAPEGWLEGDPGCFAVFFDGPADPRLAAYCSAFERPDGGSLEPAIYQMFMVPFRAAENE